MLAKSHRLHITEPCIFQWVCASVHSNKPKCSTLNKISVYFKRMSPRNSEACGTVDESALSAGVLPEFLVVSQRLKRVDRRPTPERSMQRPRINQKPSLKSRQAMSVLPENYVTEL